MPRPPDLRTPAAHLKVGVDIEGGGGEGGLKKTGDVAGDQGQCHDRRKTNTYVDHSPGIVRQRLGSEKGQGGFLLMLLLLVHKK